jgi:hypothetical protein
VNTQTVLREKNKAGLKHAMKLKVIKIVWWWYKNRHKKQWNIIRSTEIHGDIYS